ncbi:hypothetical protein B0H13DRAFT_2289873 [Mycena leptocephala]|nr:hypothetical protein B0H13DRAFT_2289873 [Mycena leptocephala]
MRYVSNTLLLTIHKKSHPNLSPNYHNPNYLCVQVRACGESKCMRMRRSSVRRASQRKSGYASPSGAAHTQTPNQDHTLTASSPQVKVVQRRTLRPARAHRVPRAVDGRGAAVVDVAAPDPIPVVTGTIGRRIHRRGPRLRLRSSRQCSGLSLSLSNGESVPVVRPHRVRAHAREGGAGAGGSDRRVVGGRLRAPTVAGRMVYGRVGVPMPKGGHRRDGGGVWLDPAPPTKWVVVASIPPGTTSTSGSGGPNANGEPPRDARCHTMYQGVAPAPRSCMGGYGYGYGTTVRRAAPTSPTSKRRGTSVACLALVDEEPERASCAWRARLVDEEPEWAPAETREEAPAHAVGREVATGGERGEGATYARLRGACVRFRGRGRGRWGSRREFLAYVAGVVFVFVLIIGFCVGVFLRFTIHGGGGSALSARLLSASASAAKATLAHGEQVASSESKSNPAR